MMIFFIPSVKLLISTVLVQMEFYLQRKPVAIQIRIYVGEVRVNNNRLSHSQLFCIVQKAKIDEVA